MIVIIVIMMMMMVIRVVTDNPSMVWNKDFNNPTSLEESQRDTMYQVLVTHATR